MASSASSPEEAFRHIADSKEELRKVFSEFENKKFTVGRIGATWKDIEEHFKEIEACLQKTFDAYALREKAFEERMSSVQAEVEKRDAEISVKEKESVARVLKEKDAAVSAILEHKRKLSEEKRKVLGEKQKTSEGRKKKTVPIGSRLPAKKDSLSVIQKKEDSLKNDSLPLSSISPKNADLPDKDSSLTPASEKKEATPKEEDQPKKESIPTKASDSSPDASKSIVKDSPADTKNTTKPIIKDDVFRENSRFSARLNPLCQNSDSDGLKKFLVEMKKDVKMLVLDITTSLRLCKDPPRFVLSTLESYFETERHGKQDFCKDDCFAWGVLMDALSDVVQKEGRSISDDVKTCAKTFADRWRATLELDGQMNFKLVLEGGNFLQFIALYGLANGYNEDELCDMVVKVARRKQTPELIRSLGIANKAPVVVEKLIKDGKAIQAVTFSCAFDLLDQFPPAPLLKSHINDAKKQANTILKSGNNSQSSQKEAIQKELAALKAVANVVKEHKLEKHYALNYVEKQVARLEKTKADKKQAIGSAVNVQHPAKRQRPDDIAGIRGRSISPKRLMYAMNDRSELGQFGRPLMGGYNDQRSLGGMYASASAYSGHPLNPSPVPNPYAYAPHGLSPLGYRSSIHGEPPPTSLMDYNYIPRLPSLRGYRPYP